MSKRNKARERKLEALAAGERNIRERLFEMRGEIDAIAHAIDRLALPRRPRIQADLGGSLPDLDSLLSFRAHRSRRP